MVAYRRSGRERAATKGCDGEGWRRVGDHGTRDRRTWHSPG